MRVLLAGCGKMGGALLQRWEERDLCEKILVVEPFEVSTTSTRIKDAKDIPADFAPDIIVLAVKPQVLPDVMPAYQRFADQACFVSIAAGKPVSFFEGALGSNAAIVRCMPNTPSAIGKGMTVGYANLHCTDVQKSHAATLLGAVGDMLWVEDEQLLTPVTALSGSGPAYVFYLIEAMTTAGIKTGLAPDIAARLARQTVIGAACLAEAETDTPPAKLRENVTSPGGTTAAALEVLMRGDMQDVFNEALAAAAKRAEELAN